MLRGWRLRARWPAPIHPELAAHLRPGFLVLISNFARCDSIDLLQEKRKGCAEPRRRGERGAKASADGARRTSPGRRAGAKWPLGRALIKRPLGGGGRSRSEGGPVTIYFDRPPPPRGSVAMYEKGAGRDPYHDRPPPSGGPVKVHRDRPPRISRPAPPPGLTVSYKKHALEAPGSFRRQSRNDQSRGFPEPLSREQSYELC